MTEETKIKTEEQKAKDFVKGYEELCDKHQMRFATTPVYKLRDDGTFSLILKISVEKSK